METPLYQYNKTMKKVYTYFSNQEGINFCCLLTMKEFFKLDQFGGKIAFFYKKKCCCGWFRRRDWARAFKLGGMITYIQGSGLLKKKSRLSDFSENHGFFSQKLDIVSFKNSYIIALEL